MNRTPTRPRWRVTGAGLLVGLLGAACAGTQPKDLQVGATGDPVALPQGGLNVPTNPGGGSPLLVPTNPGGGTASAPNRSNGTATAPPTTRSGGAATATTRPVTASPAIPGRQSAPGLPTPNPSSGQGNGGATDTGVTADSIKLGGFYIESGPLGSLGITLLKAVKAVYNEVNDQGGIYGRKIQMIDCDTSFTSGDKPRACFSKLTQQDGIFAFASAGDGPAMVTASPLICEAKIPAVWMDGLASDEFKCPYIYPTGPPARSQSHVVADYYVKAQKPKTVGFLVQNDDIGNEWRDGAKEVFEQAGVQVVTEQRYDLGDTNLNAQVINMQAARPDFIFFAGEPLGGILFQLQAKALGYKPPKPSAGVTCNVEIWPREVGQYSKGMICQHPWKLPQSGLPEHGVYEKAYKKYWNDWAQRNAYTEIHWVAARAVVETLRKVGPNLTRARLLDTLNRGAMNGFDTGFGVRFNQQASESGGNIFDTEVAVIEITEPSGTPYFYEMRQDPIPDPFFTVK